MKEVSIFKNKDITAFLFDGYFDIYTVCGQLELTEQVLLDEEGFLSEYMWTHQFDEIEYTGQLSQSGHYINFIKSKGDTVYTIYDLCDLNGLHPKYFLEELKDDKYSIFLFDSPEESEVFSALL